MAVDPLSAELLYRACDTTPFEFETTAELPDLAGLAGQDRVHDALRFGTGIRRHGYNLFVLGQDAVGQHEAVSRFLADIAGRERAPSDWAYVMRFAAPHRPIILELAAGSGAALKEGMAQLVAELKVTVPGVLDSEDYQNRSQMITEEFREKQEKAFDDLRSHAEDHGLALLRTPSGFALAPVVTQGEHRGEVLKPEVFNALPEAERKSLEAATNTLQRELADTLEHLPAWEKDHRQQMQSLINEVATRLVDSAMRDLRKRFDTSTPLREWLASVAQDLVDNVAVFAGAAPTPSQAAIALGQIAQMNFGAVDPFRRYEVNVIVGNGPQVGGPAKQPRSDFIGGGAPIIYEDHPTLQNLVGRVEHVPQMGALVTDFTLIKAGSLHRANGGYLLIDALKLLREPLAWEALKRALRRRKIIIESPGEFMSLVSTVTLEPDAVPLEIKVLLFGDRQLYYVLSNADPEFGELFKVAADFDDVLDREPENDLLYARFLAGLCRSEDLLPLDRSGVARVTERASRLAEDAEKISTAMRPIADLLREADYIARSKSADVMTAFHIDAAVEAQVARADRMRESSLELITRDIIMIDTEGECVGQVNGLSVLSMGAVSFGRPSRITARVRMGLGSARVLDIEREVDLGGPIHSKGVLILSGYLSATFLPEIPFSMSASLVFEQSYGGVDGDSASSAELYALISALAEVPIAQGLAVTGSVNQLGQVQAIGGVNDKIEGFFDICMRRGLTGEQGVLIPAANVKHLMLRQDVVDAVERGVFAIYPVETIEEGVELLMNVPAGTRGADGNFAAGSVYAKAEARLAAFADNQRRFAQRVDDNGKRK
ncbi:MAG: AAA family ATPase [Parvibaculum sp.]|nr:AAA family ATPase [Parvibaculum sp.]